MSSSESRISPAAIFSSRCARELASRARHPLTVPYVARTLPVMRTQRLELRLTDEERQLDSTAATALGESLSDFFRRAASARAQEVLADQQQVMLSEQEATRFLDALESADADMVAGLRELRRRA